MLEDKHIGDIFASDLGRVEILGKNARFVLVVKHYDAEGAVPRDVVIANVVLPIDVIPGAIARTLFALGQSAIPIAFEFTKRLN